MSSSVSDEVSMQMDRRECGDEVIMADVVLFGADLMAGVGGGSGGEGLINFRCFMFGELGSCLLVCSFWR